MKQIKLQNSDKVALISDIDFEEVSKHPWYLRRGYVRKNGSKGYAPVVELQRFIMNPPAGLLVDHINQDKLDNRRENLRLCDGFQNKWNVPMYANNKSGYKGVSKTKSGLRWRVQIGIRGKRFYVGQFDDKETAAEAYDDAARIFFGEFASLNFNHSQ